MSASPPPSVPGMHPSVCLFVGLPVHPPSCFPALPPRPLSVPAAAALRAQASCVERHGLCWSGSYWTSSMAARMRHEACQGGTETFAWESTAGTDTMNEAPVGTMNRSWWDGGGRDR